MLFESPGPFLKLSLLLIVPAVIVTALFFTLIIGLALKAQRKKPVTGTEGLVGMEGKAKEEITAKGGMVSLHGELWSAYSSETIAKDDTVIVEDVSGLRVKVKKKG